MCIRDRFKNAGIRVSIFVDPVVTMVEAAATTGTDRIELYTESYACLLYTSRCVKETGITSCISYP